MYISTINQVLSADVISRVRSLVGSKDFVHGNISGGTESNKNNRELSAKAPNYLEVLKLVESGVSRSQEFSYTAFPRSMTRPIISNYSTGMFYNEHTDSAVANFLACACPSSRWADCVSCKATSHRTLAPVGTGYVRADLSMTVFLSDPATYDGGELRFNGGESKYKPAAGAAVLYPTGAPHSVSCVTRGERLAAVFWVQSLVPLNSRRQLLRNTFSLWQSLGLHAPDSEHARQAETNFNDLFRMFAET